MVQRFSASAAAFSVAAALVAMSPAEAHFYDRNVVMLDRESWKDQLLASPHGWFVNVCRQG